jgi:hypothetical protein
LPKKLSILHSYCAKIFAQHKTLSVFLFEKAE